MQFKRPNRIGTRPIHDNQALPLETRPAAGVPLYDIPSPQERRSFLHSSVGVVADRTPSSQRKKPALQDDSARWVRLSYVLIFLFVVMQGTLILLQRNGPFFDEAIYVTAGLRTLQGKGLDDGYLVWFAGSLLWPIIAGIGYLLHGLSTVRFLALLFALITLLSTYLTARNLFGAQAACFTILAFIVNGPFLALAHLGVYDSPALAFTALSFWSMTQLKQQHRFWLCLSAVTFALAVIAKYPIGLMLLPLLAVLLYMRKEAARIDVWLFLFIFTAVFLAFFLSFQYEVGDWLFWSIANKPTFGATRSTIIFAQLYYGLLPFLLAAIGFLLSKQKRLTIILLLAAFLWPLYHIGSGNPVSDNKHVVFGFLFTYPLIGLLFARLWTKKAIGKIASSVFLLVLALIGSLQLYNLDLAWPDVRTPAGFLVQHVHVGDTLLVNDSWPYTMYLYANHNITSPWEVIDGYAITNHKATSDLCSYNWFVDEEGSYAWSESVLSKLKTCQNFVQVFQYSSQVIGLGSNNRFISYTVKTTIWQNRERDSSISLPPSQQKNVDALRQENQAGSYTVRLRWGEEVKKDEW